MKTYLKSAVLLPSIVFATGTMADVNVVWGNQLGLHWWNNAEVTTLSHQPGAIKITGDNIAWTEGRRLFVRQGQEAVLVADDVGSWEVNRQAVAYVDLNFVSDSDKARIVKFEDNAYETIFRASNFTTLRDVHLSEDNVVWWNQAFNSNSPVKDVRVFDGGQVQRLNELTNTSPSFITLPYDVSGNNIVWGHEPPRSLAYIDFWNGREHKTFRSDVFRFEDPKVDDGNIVFRGHDGSDWEIFYSDGTNVQQITTDNIDQTAPLISGDTVVWSAQDGNDNDIFVWNGERTIQLTHNDFEDKHIHLDGSYVVWSGYDGNDFEIFMWDGEKVNQLTHNDVDDFAPQVGTTENVPDDGTPSNCQFFITDEWSDGFVAKVVITNNTSVPINGWSVSWQYSDGSIVNGNAWNADISGQYTATNQPWNAVIEPGQSRDFGFLNIKTQDKAVAPIVTGDVCN